MALVIMLTPMMTEMADAMTVLDTDADGIGNNADTDDDGDGRMIIP